MADKINELENWISINQFSSLDVVNERMVLDAGAVIEFIKSLKDDPVEKEEGELCINTGNWINMCAALLDVTRNQYGDIQSQVWANRNNNTSRLLIVAGRFKKNRVALNNCPFCGENIATSYKDSSEDK